MRIPHYRVWHKQQKKMMQVQDINLCPEFGGVSTWGKAYHDHDTGEHEADKDFWRWDEIELMEYIGLKDKNGKEVYQDDILSGQLYRYGYELGEVNWRMEYTGTVRWIQRDQFCGFYLVDKNDKHEYMSLLYATHRNEDFNSDGLILEVVGNIWEQREEATDGDYK